jgi:hypothetical protein
MEGLIERNRMRNRRAAFLLAVSSLIKQTDLFGACALLPTYLAACFILRDRQKIVHGLALIASFPLFSILLWLGCGQSWSLTGMTRAGWF